MHTSAEYDQQSKFSRFRRLFVGSLWLKVWSSKIFKIFAQGLEILYYYYYYYTHTHTHLNRDIFFYSIFYSRMNHFNFLQLYIK